MRTLRLVTCLLLLAIPSFAQPSAPKEGQREVVFGRCDRPYTNIWAADAERIIRIEDDLAIVDVIYEGDFIVGETITVRSTGTRLSWRYANDTLTTPGMPAITRNHESEGRIASALADGHPFVSYAYSDGYVEEVKLKEGLSLRLSRPKEARVTQSVASGGRAVSEVTVGVAKDLAAMREFYRSPERVIVRDSPRVRAIHALNLVQSDVGSVSSDCLRLEASSSGKLTIIFDGRRPIAYVIDCGVFDMIGFSIDGQPLFYDLTMDVVKKVPEPDSCVTVDFPHDQLAHVTPDRILLSHTGATRAYVSTCVADAICGFWGEADANKR